MRRFIISGCLALLGAGWMLGCGENAHLFNPSFVNYAIGGVTPIVPGAESGFVLVRVVNRLTGEDRPPVSFVVSAERQVFTTNEFGMTTTEMITETARLRTDQQAPGNEAGVLFDCPVLRVGLGENLNFPTSEPGVFLEADEGLAEGFGVPGNLNPLDATVNPPNFVCGDTIIFMASPAPGNVGNLKVQSYVLPDETAPEEYTGPNPFINARTAIDQRTFNTD